MVVPPIFNPVHAIIPRSQVVDHIAVRLDIEAGVGAIGEGTVDDLVPATVALDDEAIAVYSSRWRMDCHSVAAVMRLDILEGYLIATAGQVQRLNRMTHNRVSKDNPLTKIKIKRIEILSHHILDDDVLAFPEVDPSMILPKDIAYRDVLLVLEGMPGFRSAL